MTDDKSPAKCNSCCHAIVENEEQVGCKLNLLEKLQAYKEDEEKYFYLNKLCLFKNKNQDDVDVKLGYLFIYNKGVDLQDLLNNIEAIKTQNPSWVGVSSYTTEGHELIKRSLDELKCRYNVVMNYKEVDNIYKLDQFIDLFHNGWTVVNIVGEELFLPKEKLSSFILNGNRAAIIKHDKSPDMIEINGVAYFNYLYKMLNGNLPESTEEEGILISKSFAHKVFERSPSMIVSWEDL